MEVAVGERQGCALMEIDSLLRPITMLVVTTLNMGKMLEMVKMNNDGHLSHSLASWLQPSLSAVVIDQ